MSSPHQFLKQVRGECLKLAPFCDKGRCGERENGDRLPTAHRPEPQRPEPPVKEPPKEPHHPGKEPNRADYDNERDYRDAHDAWKDGR